MNEILEKAKQNMLLKEKELSPYACKSEQGIWLKEDKEDIRPIFFRDIDRIIHSSGYARYIDKTQVYSFIQNDHITRRVLHVQLVSKIARFYTLCIDIKPCILRSYSCCFSFMIHRNTDDKHPCFCRQSQYNCCGNLFFQKD